MYQKQNGLTVGSPNLRKIDVIEIERVTYSEAGGRRKNAGGKMKVTSIMLLKTHGEKMTEIGFSIMLLKSKEL